MSEYRYERVVEQHLDVAQRSGEEFTARCFLHDDSRASMRVNVRTGAWICHGCQARGNSKSLFKHLGLTGQEPDMEVRDLHRMLDRLETTPSAPERLPRLPEATLKRYGFPTTYWDSRGFTPDTQRLFGLGYDALAGDAIIPVRDLQGRLLSVIRRRLQADHGPKYLYAKGFPRKRLLFGSWLVADSDTEHVAVTEGSLDAIAVWQAGIPAVAQFGSALSDEQATLLRRLGISRVTLFYDGDPAGVRATDAAKAVLRDFEIRVVRYTDADGPRPDPGGMRPEAIRERVEAAQSCFSD